LLRAGEKLEPDGALQRFDMPRHGRLRKPEHARRAGKRALLQHGKETSIEAPIGLLGIHLF
jgi:hypothetical protein